MNEAHDRRIPGNIPALSTLAPSHTDPLHSGWVRIVLLVGRLFEGADIHSKAKTAEPSTHEGNVLSV